MKKIGILKLPSFIFNFSKKDIGHKKEVKSTGIMFHAYIILCVFYVVFVNVINNFYV